jgi:hypothetical protein
LPLLFLYDHKASKTFSLLLLLPASASCSAQCVPRASTR